MNPTQTLAASVDLGHESGDETRLYKELQKYVGLIFFLRQGYQDEDFISETLSDLFMRRDRFRGESSFSTWAFKVVSNAHLMWLRRQRRLRQREAPLEEAYGLSSESPPDLRPLLERHLKRLSNEEQTLMELFLSGMTQREIGAELKWSRRTVQRALKETEMKLMRFTSETESEGEEDV